MAIKILLGRERERHFFAAEVIILYGPSDTLLGRHTIKEGDRS